MFCQKCGTQNPDDGKFCSKCGNDLKSTIQAERKGISGKLGKMGIPGFRSGKTWKMAIAIFGYFGIFLILLALISPTPAPKISPPQATVQETIAKLPTLTPTPVDTSPAPIITAKSNEQITIRYSGKTTNSIGQYSQASPGKTFLIVTMTIENKGYQSLNTNPNYFNIVIDKIKYSYTAETYQLPDKLDTIDILDGGTITGSIAFSIPANTNKYELLYDQAFRNYNIEYIPNNLVP